jgi:hypothetical protein
MVLLMQFEKLIIDREKANRMQSSFISLNPRKLRKNLVFQSPVGDSARLRVNQRQTH